MISGLAGELGFEPRQTESESVVLPLHHSPRIYKRIQYVIRFCLAIACDGIRQIPAECGCRSTRSLPALASGGNAAFCETTACNFRGDFQCPAHEIARTVEFKLRCGTAEVNAGTFECASPAIAIRPPTFDDSRTSQRKRHRLPIRSAIEAGVLAIRSERNIPRSGPNLPLFPGHAMLRGR